MGKKARTIDAPRTSAEDKTSFCLREYARNFKMWGFPQLVPVTGYMRGLKKNQKSKIRESKQGFRYGGTGGYERGGALSPQPSFVKKNKKMRGTKCCLWLFYIKSEMKSDGIIRRVPGMVGE